MRKLIILGARGIPAEHGGFETFCERLALFLTSCGWDVTVYCQASGSDSRQETIWNGVHRIHIPVRGEGALSTVTFDWKASIDALRQDGLVLVLGYNTAGFNILQRLKRQTLLFNMDGLEWQRDKWGSVAKAWFWMNERLGCWFGHHLIADHPEIKKHLATRVRDQKITMIPYGGDDVVSADAHHLENFDVEPGEYSIIVARPEPENFVLQIVDAFSETRRNHKLVVLGRYQPERNAYHRAVLEAASDEVVFIGAIYDLPVVSALRAFSHLYVHGHQVGGTNPSLVEAMGAGCAIVAHDNPFNRWVAGSRAAYFSDKPTCSALIARLLADDGLVTDMRQASRNRFHERFTWDRILHDYEKLLSFWCPET